MAVVLWLALRHDGAALLSPADPTETYGAARPEWFLLGVYEFSHWFSGESAIVPIFVVPGLVLCIVLAMPFLARWRWVTSSTWPLPGTAGRTGMAVVSFAQGRPGGREVPASGGGRRAADQAAFSIWPGMRAFRRPGR